ncbi:MFS transporter [Nocardioides sp. Kera G14]|uniref:MFS transporter n=1 Tax=Nocardioides sp. Kera G14 TaxID=2884264 RepID=UPI001D0F5833|nr:MFS transporter [Nocardioides sp. Kera G14]UDY23217.1 MFS transporter [Nocardioides sp. Kera G14]
MTTAASPPAVSPARRWAMLGASTAAQACAAVMMHGAAFLIPALHSQEDLSLGQAGIVAAAPTTGVMLALVAWGSLADAYGEKRVLLAGLVLATLSGVVAMSTHSLVLFTIAIGVAGAAAASTPAASGRVVVGWFPPHRRGLAMGIRQMAQPVGVGIAAISMAVTADAHGIRAAIAIPTIACALAAVAVALVVMDPPRPERTVEHSANPYRGNSFLARIHGVSVLLVVPQFVVWTFSLVWLEQDRHWSAAAAGTLVAVAQVAGAFGRIAAGQLSDMVGSRMRPLLWVAIGAGVVMALLGLTAKADWWVAVPLMLVATVLTVADNGLAFTAVAERAGPFWSGRAMGVQNTAQFLTSSLVPPLGGALVGAVGFPWTFTLAAAFPLVAIGLVPLRHERPVG